MVCFSKGFDGGKFLMAIVEGFAFCDDFFHLDGDVRVQILLLMACLCFVLFANLNENTEKLVSFGKVGCCGGEIFLCLDLEDSFNRL